MKNINVMKKKQAIMVHAINIISDLELCVKLANY
jgi:hypothetical protein